MTNPMSAGWRRLLKGLDGHPRRQRRADRMRSAREVSRNQGPQGEPDWRITPPGVSGP